MGSRWRTDFSWPRSCAERQWSWRQSRTVHVPKHPGCQQPGRGPRTCFRGSRGWTQGGTYGVLPGWWYTYPSEKYESQLGFLFPIYGKIKNGPNHQPVVILSSYIVGLLVEEIRWMFNGCGCNLNFSWLMRGATLKSWHLSPRMTAWMT